jgi:hypothetical protein
MQIQGRKPVRPFVFFGALLLTTSALAQEKHVSTDASVRTMLNFKAPASAVEKLLPAGWQVEAPASGPAAGANLRITFIDGVWAHDAEGKPQPATGRNITVGVPVKRQGTEIRGQMLFGGFTTGAAPGVYSVFAKSNTTSQRTFRTSADGVATVEEVWDAKSDGGDAIQYQLNYVRGVAAAEKIDVRIYSGAKPEFYRIYRYTQAADVVRGAGATPERVKSFTFKATGPKLAPLFDGTEQLVSIVALPYYSRQVYLPGS